MMRVKTPASRTKPHQALCIASQVDCAQKPSQPRGVKRTMRRGGVLRCIPAPTNGAYNGVSLCSDSTMSGKTQRLHRVEEVREVWRHLDRSRVR